MWKRLFIELQITIYRAVAHSAFCFFDDGACSIFICHVYEIGTNHAIALKSSKWCQVNVFGINNKHTTNFYILTFPSFKVACAYNNTVCPPFAQRFHLHNVFLSLERCYSTFSLHVKHRIIRYAYLSRWKSQSTCSGVLGFLILSWHGLLNIHLSCILSWYKQRLSIEMINLTHYSTLDNNYLHTLIFVFEIFLSIKLSFLCDQTIFVTVFV